MTSTRTKISNLYTSELTLKGFNIHEVSGTVNAVQVPGRRDFYKIVLMTGDLTLCSGDRPTELSGTFLFFANPHVPHSVVHHSTENKGYACLFTDAFIAGRERTELLQNSPLVRVEGTPIIPLILEQAAFMTGLYQKMLSIQRSGYSYKDELIRSCLELIIHESVRIHPPQHGTEQKNAATRMTHLFIDLLERQFPIESTTDPLRLRTALDFAESLAVHVNYLNRSVKNVTGKPTSVHIAERIVAEAKALLQHSNWPVADIAYGLGFDYPTYFNNYFKRVTGVPPRFFRKSKV